MEKELEASYPALNIELLGVNFWGQEPGNASATQGRDIPMLQDEDTDSNGVSDVWNLWDVEYRDVVIVDGSNTKVGTYNLTTYNLADEDSYAGLHEMLVDAAMQSQKPWMNPLDELDVDESTFVSPIDALIVINELNSVGSHELPPPTASSLSPPYFDCNGDGYLTPSDVLQVINFLNEESAASGEGEAASSGDVSYVAMPASTDTAKDGALPYAPIQDLSPVDGGLFSHRPSIQNRVSIDAKAEKAADVDELFAALQAGQADLSLAARAELDADSEEHIEWRHRGRSRLVNHLDASLLEELL